MRLLGRGAATAQAVYGTLAIGASTALITFASGWLYASLAGASFWVMALLCIIAIPLTAGLTSDFSNSSPTRAKG